MSALGDMIADGLAGLGLSHVQAAHQLGLHRGAVSKWVTGESVPGPAVADELASMLGRPVIAELANQTRGKHSAATSRSWEERRARAKRTSSSPVELVPTATLDRLVEMLDGLIHTVATLQDRVDQIDRRVPANHRRIADGGVRVRHQRRVAA